MILEQNGIIDYRDNGRYFNQGQGEWSDLTSWDTWSSWTLDPFATLYLTFNPIDLGSIETVNIVTDIRCRGIVHYYIYYNSTSTDWTDSPLNYSTLHITNGQQNIPSITARYIWIKLALDLDEAEGFQYFDSINYRASQNSTTGKTITFTNINSSTLSGTASDRVYTPPVDVGTIKSAQITSRGAVSSYDVDMYVYHSATSNRTTPQIISTGSNIHLTFTGVDGRPRDSNFDITLTVNPEWYMDEQGNLKER